MIRSEEPIVSPAEDAASMAGLELAPAVEAIAAQLRRIHIERRMAEPDVSTFSKVLKWRSGKCLPMGGRHRVGGKLR